MSGSPLTRRLYWALLHKARHFDQNPALKGLLKDLDGFEPLNLQYLYSPSRKQSFVQLVRQAFRQPKKEGIDTDLGFDVLRYLNEADTKYYRSVYPTTPKGKRPFPQPKTTADIKGQAMLQRMLDKGKLWALPVDVTAPAPLSDSLAPQTPGAIIPAQTSSQIIQKFVGAIEYLRGKGIIHRDLESATAPDLQPLTPGIILATHPLSEWPFPKCAMLILNSASSQAPTDTYVDALILNYPRTYPLGDRNWVVPAGLRHQHCHIGGPTICSEMPPVPNYHILHPYAAIANAKILIPDEERPVCVSTGDDFTAIADYIAQGKAVPEDFHIFVGSVVMKKNELQKQTQDGFWMPVMASANLVHHARSFGPLFWDGIMESCGGEFAHMPLISSLVEHPTPTPAPGIA